MAVTKLKCPVCSSTWVEKRRSRKFGGNCLVTSTCGHTINEKQLVRYHEIKEEENLRAIVADCFKLVVLDLLFPEKKIEEKKKEEYDSSKPESIVSVDGKKLFPFQCEVVKQVEAANVVALVEFQMGLGKTPISDTVLNLHPEICPALIICKGSIKWQHFKEMIRWNGGSKAGIAHSNPIEWTSQVIMAGDDMIIPGFQAYITSYDMLRRLDVEDFKRIGIKTIIIDECQKISNHTSKRSVELRKFTDEMDVRYRLALSGTPIKNSPKEFFSVLNWLRPDIFYSKKGFENEWIDYKWDARKNKYVISGIRNPEAFHELTKGFIFRKTREEVKEQIGLSVTEPFRDFQYLDIDKDLRKGYAEIEQQFSTFFVQHELEGSKYSFADYSHILALFAKMRHLAGLSKIAWTEEFLSEWLSSNSEVNKRGFLPKIAIFTHHIDVANYLKNCVYNITQLEDYDWSALHLPSGLTPENQDRIQEEFNFGKSRVLIASTLGSGEGINLQHNCSSAIMMERQWNPANEEQAESRFIRIGQDADLVTVTYPTVLGTIDEYFTELVEKKRVMLKEIKEGKASQIPWDEEAIVMEMANAIVKKRGGKRWSY
jgi:SNF2 family DNA or RNA helicase